MIKISSTFFDILRHNVILFQSHHLFTKPSKSEPVVIMPHFLRQCARNFFVTRKITIVSLYSPLKKHELLHFGLDWTRSRQSFRIRFEDRILTRIRNVLRCHEERARVYRRRRRRWQGDEGPPRGRRTLTGREASQEDYRKQIISVEIPLANSLSTLPRRSVSGPKLPAELQRRERK